MRSPGPIFESVVRMGWNKQQEAASGATGMSLLRTLFTNTHRNVVIEAGRLGNGVVIQ